MYFPAKWLRGSVAPGDKAAVLLAMFTCRHLKLKVHIVSWRILHIDRASGYIGTLAIVSPICSEHKSRDSLSIR